MKKLLVAIATLSTSLAFGQASMGDYIVKVETGKSYSPLTTGTNISSGFSWDDENFKIPIGFTTNIGGMTTSDFSFSTGWGFAPGSDTMGIVNTFVAFGALDLQDRGAVSGIAKSPLRYLVSGVSPNRIFKFEIANAGFFEERYIYGSMDDYTNIQIWVYETSNIVEIRYGDSKISNPDDYFSVGGAPLVGYVSNFDLDADTFSKGYFLIGNPGSPIVDSATSLFDIGNSMSDYPASGTVYRFIPKTVAASIGEINIAEQLKVYPTQATTNITVVSNLNTEANADIYAVSGQKILSNISLQKGNNIIDVSTLASGVYFLKINAEDGKADFKFVKQ